MWSGEMNPTDPPMSPWRVRPTNPAFSRKLLARPKSESLTCGRLRRPHDQQVRWLDVAMDVPLRVGVVERREQQPADPGGRARSAADAERPLTQSSGVLAGHVLHDELELALDLEDFVKRHDVGVALAVGHQEVFEDLISRRK